VLRDVEPLKIAPPEPPPAAAVIKPASKPTILSHKTRRAAPPPAAPAPAPAALEQGNYAGIDRKTAERFRKGKYAIDAALDLHGLTRERAYHALSSFVQGQYAHGSRCLLVITGKGLRGKGEAEERGVLRELLPRWLDEPALRPLILALESARPQHGGGGAYYLLLKRKR